MKFSEICVILGCPADVVAGEHVPDDAPTCEEVEAAMFLALMDYDSNYEQDDVDDYLDWQDYWADF
jgi:hypothetical protein